MKTPLNPWKRACGLGALILAGLLAANAARAEMLTFTAAGVNGQPINATYQPVTNVHVSYIAVTVFNGNCGYGRDHTTGQTACGNNFYTYQNYTVPGNPPETFIFDRPVSIPSLYYATYLSGAGKTNVIIRAFADTNATSLLYSNTVNALGTPWNYSAFTDLASLGTNIMRLEVHCAAGVAVVDDITVYGQAPGDLQAIHLNLAQTNLMPGMTAQAAIIADYTLCTNDVTAWMGGAYDTSDPSVARISSGGLVTPVGPGTAALTARFGVLTASQTVTVAPLPAGGTLVTFNNAGVSSATPTSVQIPAIYAPVADLFIDWTDAGLYNGGPDHTTYLRSSTSWGACQYNTASDWSIPQAYGFSQPVSLPSLWLSTYAGAGSGSNVVTIRAYNASLELLGTVTVTTPVHAGPGNFQWVQCTDLDNATYNGQIARVEFSAPGRAQVDDMVVVPYYGALTALNVQPVTGLLPSMSRRATVLADYETKSGVNVTGSVLFNSSNPSVLSVSPSGVLQAVAPGTATLWATLQGLSNSVEIVVSALQAGVTLVNFNDGLPSSALNQRAFNDSSYQPVPNLGMSYLGMSLANGEPWGGTDHTTGLTGGNHYFAFSGTTTPAAIRFNRPVSIPLVWLTTAAGTGTSPYSTNVTVKVYSDAAGTSLVSSNLVPTLAHPANAGLIWEPFAGLASLSNIMRVEFSSAGYANFDDMQVALSPLQALHLQLGLTSLVLGASQQATVLADYQSLAGVDVTTNANVAYSSSNPAVVTVTTNGLVQAVGPGNATVTATLDSLSSAVEVSVTALSLQMNLVGTNLTFSWPTDATASFILESSPVLGPDGVWTAVSGTPTVVGTNYELTVPVDPEAPAAYFRLRLQQ